MTVLARKDAENLEGFSLACWYEQDFYPLILNKSLEFFRNSLLQLWLLCTGGEVDMLEQGDTNSKGQVQRKAIVLQLPDCFLLPQRAAASCRAV